jgi:hypothetical protein
MKLIREEFPKKKSLATRQIERGQATREGRQQERAGNKRGQATREGRGHKNERR